VNQDKQTTEKNPSATADGKPLHAELYMSNRMTPSPEAKNGAQEPKKG
jgi:hypothetical protein